MLKIQQNFFKDNDKQALKNNQTYANNSDKIAVKVNGELKERLALDHYNEKLMK